MTLLRAASAALLVPLIFAGCQHIPREPLHLDAIREELSGRPLDLEPIRDYAQTLQSPAGPATTPFNPGDGLSLAEAEAVGLWYNPEARRARLDVAHARAGADASGRWPDPRILMGAGRKETDVPDGVERAWITNSGLELTVPLSGRAGAERRLQDQARETAVRAAAETEWRTLTRIREAWLDWSAAAARLDLLDAHLDTLRPFHVMAQSLGTAGELPVANVRLLTVEFERAAAKRQSYAAEAEAARIQVLATLGLAPDAPVVLHPATALATYAPELPDTPEINRDHPVLAHHRARYKQAEQQLRLELRKQYPDLTLTPTFTDEQDETALVLGLGAPIPVWNANRAGIAEAAAARDRARLDAEQAYHGLLADRARDEARFEGANAAWEALTEGAAATLDDQMRQARALWETGELDLPLLYDILRQSLETREQLLDTLVRRCRMALRLRAAATTGAPTPAPDKDTQP